MYFTDIFPLISSILVFTLGLIVFLKDTKSRINLTFFLHAISITIWLFSTFMMFINRSNVDLVIFWDRVVYAGVVFIPVLMHHFLLAYTNKKRDFLLIFGYSLSFIFLCFIPTNLFVKDVFIYEWGAHTQAQILHHFFLLYFVSYVIIWFFQIIKYYKNTKIASIRLKTKYIIFSFLVLFCMGPLAYLPAYGISIYPFSYVSGLFFVIIFSYAIVKHRLMDIKFVMRKYSVYLLSLVPIVLFVACVRYIFGIFLLKQVVVLDFFILVLSLLFYPTLKEYFYRFSNKYFFSSLYDSKQLITELSDEIGKTLEIRKIYDLIYKTLLKAFHFKFFVILKYNEKSSSYLIQFNRGLDIGRKKKFPGNNGLSEIFKKEYKIIVVDELKKSEYSNNIVKAIEAFKSLDVQVFVPLNIKDKTIGLLVFGSKESKDLYNDEDLQVLQIISAQVAMVIENATLYQETKDFNIKLAQEVEKATHDLRTANKNLTKLDQAKSEFISIASHQLRTPLTVIKGYISMMLEKSFGDLSGPEIDALKKVYESNERLIKLVENLLNISRIESGRLQFMFEDIHLETVVDSVMEELENTARMKKLKLNYEKPEKLSPPVKLDTEKIRQVIMNLIDNSIKYTNRGTVTVAIKQDKKNIEFSVSDSGIGVSNSDIKNLFKKFSRGKDVSLVHTEGTGLGLYVAKQMIQYHKGKIWVESKGVGKGSRFVFTLPIVK